MGRINKKFSTGKLFAKIGRTDKIDCRKWYYVLLSDRTFYNNQKSNTTVSKILKINVLNKNFFKKQFELF